MVDPIIVLVGDEYHGEPILAQSLADLQNRNWTVILRGGANADSFRAIMCVIVTL
jgi:hypothetical protein